MLVDDVANTWGTIGGGCVEAEVRRRAHALMGEHGSGVLQFTLDHDFGWDDGLICGGTIHLAVAPLPGADDIDAIAEAIEHRRPASIDFVVQDEAAAAQRYTLKLPPRERLYIAGAGHVGQALARLALQLEFEVTMFDDRADLLERFAPPEAGKVSGDIAGALKVSDIDEQTYCVIVTRGHRHDEQALSAVLNRGARYVGMIGSRRKVKLIFGDLREMGCDEAALSDVVAPIGLDIGSETVEEIALSIAAQLVEVRRRNSIERVVGPIPLESKGPDASAARP
jgi:xanthine dehydrogenase accessory factor